MGRVKLEIPTDFIFETELPIRIGDINYGGHLGNDAVLSLVHEARIRFFKSNGFTELDVAGAGIILSDVVIVYRAEAFYGQTLRVEVTAGDFTRTGCDLFYRLTDRESGNEVARSKTGIAFFDYDRRKVVAVPDAFRELFDPADPTGEA